jgi:hypothetical protein
MERKTMKEVRFNANSTDLALIEGIVDRGMSIPWLAASYASRMEMLMDVTAVHLNGNPLRLKDMLGADDFNFAHDMSGICNCLDRETGQLMNNFSPRFSRREG